MHDGSVCCMGIGRLKAGLTLANAETDLSRRIKRETITDARVVMTPMVDDYFGRLRWALVAALASVFLLLAVACSNIASLLLARFARRRQEWAVRLAIGGTTLDVVRLSVVETVLIGIAASTVGTLTVPGLLRMVVAFDPSGFLAAYPLEIDIRVVVVTLAIAGATMVLVGLGPAAYVARMRTSEVVTPRLRHRVSIARARTLLVMAQLAVAVFLVAGA